MGDGGVMTMDGRWANAAQVVKEAVLAGDTLRVIVDLVSGPLAHHPRMSDQDSATVQLVLSFVRNLLAVSDAKATEGAGGDHRSRLRGDLLAALDRDHVLELLLTFATFSDMVRCAPPCRIG